MNYVVHKVPQPNGEFEVHREGCWFFPLSFQSVPLGSFNTSARAVDAAKKIYPSATACRYCCQWFSSAILRQILR